MTSWEIVVAAGALGVTGATMFAAGGGYLPFTLGLDSLTLHAGDDQLLLRGLDASTMSRLGIWGWGLPALGIFVGVWAILALTAVTLLGWFSFRLRVTVSARETCIERVALFKVCWERRVCAHRPRLSVDGWGDEMDPEALLLWLDESEKHELGWSHAKSGERAAELARRFNAAVSALRANDSSAGPHPS